MIFYMEINITSVTKYTGYTIFFKVLDANILKFNEKVLKTKPVPYFFSMRCC